MANHIIREGRTWHEYRVYENSGRGGEALKVLFNSEDLWVDDDYWWHVKSYKPSRKSRAYVLMSRLENRKQTNTLRYQIARCAVLSEMGHAEVAKKHLKNWRS